jgi:DNA gyrase subunit A
VKDLVEAEGEPSSTEDNGEKTSIPEPTEEERNIVERYLEDEMKTSYMDYSMSVIVQRALPDVRDGLKPVHRRILYAMHEAGISASKPFKKSARIVGDVLGKYHPHGDTAVYDAIVRMAQDFSLRYPLVDGQGNFGSVDGDSAAAMRYTESRMAKIAEEMITDIDKDTIDFVPNYDGSLKEPTVLPAKLPNMLINGASGIAVGMATNIAPHNLTEIVDGILAIIDNPDINTLDLMEIIKGPDFPTGGIIYGAQGIASAYHTGRGLVRVRGKIDIEEMAHDKKRVVVTEIPYQVNKSTLIENIAALVRDKRVEGITDLRDESDREGMRIVIELKRDANDEVILNQLYKLTPLESTFGINNLALVKNQPKLLPLKETLMYFIEHRQEVIRRRTEFELAKAEARVHILKGLLIALDALDEVIALIRGSSTVEDARNGLIERFNLSEEQAKAILEMRLQKLTSMEASKIQEEHDELLQKIEELKGILASEEKILEIIKEESLELKNKYGDERRTEIIEAGEEIEIEDLIPVENVVITITNTGYIKRLPVDTYKQQRRGGKGLIGIRTREEDYVIDLFITSTHNFILFFTNKGRVYWLKAYKIPMGDRYAKGKPIINLLPRLDEDEDIQTMIPISVFDNKHFLVFVTRNGYIKKTVLSAYSRPRADGIWAIRLEETDQLVDVKLTDGTQEIMIASANGQANRFNETEVRRMGRYARGVRGLRLKKGDKVIGMAVVGPDSILLTLKENGYGKRSRVKDYRKTHRGSKGVINIKTLSPIGNVVTVQVVKGDNELIVTSEQGMVIRIPVKGISVIGRATKGVRIMNLKDDDRVVAVARIITEKEEEAEIEVAEETVTPPKPYEDDHLILFEQREEIELDKDKAEEEGGFECPDCGTVLDLGTTKCPECGTEFEIDEEEDEEEEFDADEEEFFEEE